MIQRLALFIASLAAAAVLVVGLSAAGFSTAGGPAAANPTASTVVVTNTADPTAPAPVQVDTVYVAAPPKPQTIVEHRTVAAPAGEHEGAENESSNGDD